MKILGNADTIRYVGFRNLEDTGIVSAGFTIKDENDWAYRLIAKEIGTSIERMLRPKEEHTGNVLRVSSAEGGEGTMRPSSLTNADGAVTDERGLALCLIASDCAAVYLVDPVRNCIGLSHSGRMGTQFDIAAATVKMMTDCFGSDPADIVSAIGPCICQSCYEVDAVTAQEFSGCLKKEWGSDLIREKNGRFYLDIAGTIRCQLEEAGVNRIQMPEYCTCHDEHFYSYRGGDGRESNAAWLMLTEKKDQR